MYTYTYEPHHNPCERARAAAQRPCERVGHARVWFDTCACTRARTWLGVMERLEEYGWKPHRDVLAQTKAITGPMLLIYA